MSSYADVHGAGQSAEATTAAAVLAAAAVHTVAAVTATDADGDTLTYSVAATTDSDATEHLTAFNEDFGLDAAAAGAVGGGATAGDGHRQITVRPGSGGASISTTRCCTGYTVRRRVSGHRQRGRRRATGGRLRDADGHGPIDDAARRATVTVLTPERPDEAVRRVGAQSAAPRQVGAC